MDSITPGLRLMEANRAETQNRAAECDDRSTETGKHDGENGLMWSCAGPSHTSASPH